MIRFRIDVCDVAWKHPGSTLMAEYKLWEHAALDLTALGWSPHGRDDTTVWTSDVSPHYCVIRSETVE